MSRFTQGHGAKVSVICETGISPTSRSVDLAVKFTAQVLINPDQQLRVLLPPADLRALSDAVSQAIAFVEGKEPDATSTVVD